MINLGLSIAVGLIAILIAGAIVTVAAILLDAARGARDYYDYTDHEL